MLFEKEQLSPHWVYWNTGLEDRCVIKTLNFVFLPLYFILIPQLRMGLWSRRNTILTGR